jgi:DNA-binding transcriptional regulator YiaG
MTRSPQTEDEANFAVNLGMVIAATRRAAKLNQADFATQLGVGRNKIWRWETGRALPNAYELAQIRQIKAPR